MAVSSLVEGESERTRQERKEVGDINTADVTGYDMCVRLAKHESDFDDASGRPPEPNAHRRR